MNNPEVGSTLGVILGWLLEPARKSSLKMGQHLVTLNPKYLRVTLKSPQNDLKTIMGN
jgi:hypothetical protein